MTPAFHRIHAQAELASKNFSPLWISGEPGRQGTLARAIHYHGVTRELAFATIDCAGLQPYLIRSLLFGHNGLAETGRVGTIYLKSPDSIPADLQAELIEWSELLSDQCRVAVGCKSGDNLSEAFRAAFGVIESQLPTLVERKVELPRLLDKLLEEEREAGANTKGVSPEATEVLSGWTARGIYKNFALSSRCRTTGNGANQSSIFRWRFAEEMLMLSRGRGLKLRKSRNWTKCSNRSNAE